jgi:hypothetical protein
MSFDRHAKEPILAYDKQDVAPVTPFSHVLDSSPKHYPRVSASIFEDVGQGEELDITYSPVSSLYDRVRLASFAFLNEGT